jgi:hypothetical protein
MIAREEELCRRYVPIFIRVTLTASFSSLKSVHNLSELELIAEDLKLINLEQKSRTKPIENESKIKEKQRKEKKKIHIYLRGVDIGIALVNNFFEHLERVPDIHYFLHAH